MPIKPIQDQLKQIQLQSSPSQKAMEHKEKDRLKKLFYFMHPLANSPSKWKGFREFLRSPLHGNSEKEAEFLDHIAKVIGESGSVAEKKLSKLILPDLSYNDPATRNNLRRRLNPILEHYYAYEALLRFQKDKVMKWRYVIQEANLAQWDDYFPWIYEKKARKALKSSPRTESFFIHKMDFEDQRDQFLSRQERDPTEIENRYLPEMDALDNAYAIYLLKIACNKYNLNLLAKIKKAPRLPLLAALLKEIESNWEKQESLVQMYYLILRDLQSPLENQFYFSLGPILEKEAIKYGQQEARKVFQHTTNLCIRKYNHHKRTGNKSESQLFQKEILKLYNYKLAHGLIFHYANGIEYIDHGDFKNMVVLFSKMGETDWTSNFIERYSGQVLKNLRSVVRNFNQGILYFYQNKFHQAERLFSFVMQELKDSNDKYYALSVKGYYLRVLYEQKKLEDCERQAKNIAKSIHRNKRLPKAEKQKSIQLCQHLQKLCKAESETKAQQSLALEQVREQIETGPPCASKAWLLEKVAAAMP